MPAPSAESIATEDATTEGEEEAYPDAQSISSPTKTIRETVELGQEDTEPEPLSCPVCSGEMVTQQKIELGEWCTLYTEACPQERMGCLHAIQARRGVLYRQRSAVRVWPLKKSKRAAGKTPCGLFWNSRQQEDLTFPPFLCRMKTEF